jgi:hypothetical protein
MKAQPCHNCNHGRCSAAGRKYQKDSKPCDTKGTIIESILFYRVDSLSELLVRTMRTTNLAGVLGKFNKNISDYISVPLT